MKKTIFSVQIFVALAIVFVSFASPSGVQASTPDPLVGNWYADWESSAGYGGNFRFEIFTIGSDYYATMYIPDLGIINQQVPVTISEDTIYFLFLSPPFPPPGFALIGTITDNVIQGAQFLPVPYPPGYDWITWQAVKLTVEDIDLDPGPGSECDELPPLYCTGSAEYCSELVNFDPTFGVGYTDFPENGETWDNQFRSYIRRDLMKLIQYATAKVECKTADWEFGSGEPLGLIDMSEADGSIPGTSVGYPAHPPDTHMFGKDIDLAYYQLHLPDNMGRIVCDHHEFDENYNVVDAYHCTSEPYFLDPWRTTLLTTYLAEHPQLRVMGVDGQVGLMMADSYDWLEANGWIDPALRGTIPFLYEVEDQGWGFYKFHHHHMHVSMNPVEPILDSLEFAPETMDLHSNGKYITAYIELVYDPGWIDVQTVMLSVDGHSVLYAEPDKSAVGDYDEDGILDLMVKFDRQALHTMLSPGLNEITLYGVADGIHFQGVDTILVR